MSKIGDNISKTIAKAKAALHNRKALAAAKRDLRKSKFLEMFETADSNVKDKINKIRSKTNNNLDAAENIVKKNEPKKPLDKIKENIIPILSGGALGVGGLSAYSIYRKKKND